MMLLVAIVAGLTRAAELPSGDRLDSGDGARRWHYAPEAIKQREDAKKQLEGARRWHYAPEAIKQREDAKKQLEGERRWHYAPEAIKQREDAKKQLEGARRWHNSPEAKKQREGARRFYNSPEAKNQRGALVELVDGEGARRYYNSVQAKKQRGEYDDEDDEVELVDYAPLAPIVDIDSTSYRWGGEAKDVLTDGDESTLWHQGNDGWNEVPFMFYFEEPVTITEIRTATPTNSGNYGYKAMRVMFRGSDYKWNYMDGPEQAYFRTTDCSAGRHLTHVINDNHNRNKDITAISIKLMEKCGGNHFALTELKLLGPKQAAASVFAGPVATSRAAAAALAAGVLGGAFVVGLALKRALAAAPKEAGYGELA